MIAVPVSVTLIVNRALTFLPTNSLARAEMLLAVANVFRDVKFELYETTREDVTMAHELFLAFPKIGSKGVRVLVTE